MPTTVHLPRDLLERVDRRARGLGISRNRFVHRALDHLLAHETEWSVPFLRTLNEAASDIDTRKAVDDMMHGIARRSRKEPPKL